MCGRSCEERTKEEVSRLSGGWSKESKVSGENSLPRNAGKPDGRGGDEAAAKGEGHDRYDKENQVKRSINANNSWWDS